MLPRIVHDPARWRARAFPTVCFVWQGTEKRTKEQLELEVENMGAHLNAYTSREQTVYYAKVRWSLVLLCNGCGCATAGTRSNTHPPFGRLGVPKGCCTGSGHSVRHSAELQAEPGRHRARARCDPGAHTLAAPSGPACGVAKQKVVVPSRREQREEEEVAKSEEEVTFDRLHSMAYQNTPLDKLILGSRENIANINRDDLADVRKNARHPKLLTATDLDCHLSVLGYCRCLHTPLTVVRSTSKPTTQPPAVSWSGLVRSTTTSCVSLE